MEATMYEDTNSQPHSHSSSPLMTMMTVHSVSNGTGNGVKALKRSMTLDLNSGLGKPSAKRAKLGNSAVGAVLASPDLNMLKLASPELERMIIQQNGMVTTTPTPTQFICPKYVTEEQEAYARGFVDALEELHRKREDMTPPRKEKRKITEGGSIDAPAFTVLQPVITSRTLPSISTVTRPNHTQQNVYAVSLPINSTYQTTYPMAQPQAVITHPATTSAHDKLQYQPMNGLSTIVNNKLHHIKEEPQTVPCTPPPPQLLCEPINLEHQEVHKSERKRARNRIAARKCRHRKLERITRLEDKIDQLKGQNSELSNTATTLREQVCALKQQILEHVKNGCQVLMSQNLAL